jgi:hypothetical protein
MNNTPFRSKNSKKKLFIGRMANVMKREGKLKSENSRFHYSLEELVVLEAHIHTQSQTTGIGPAIDRAHEISGAPRYTLRPLREGQRLGG